MHTPVITIGLDAADPNLIEKWLSAGYLPTIRKLWEKGSYRRLKTFDYYRAETPWTTFLSGCEPNQTGYWAPLKFWPERYAVEDVQAYNFQEYAPFYSICDNKKVAVFDMPQSILSEQVDGLQVLAWGAHSPMTPSHSQPPELLNELVQKYGEHPVLRKDHAPVQNWKQLKELQHHLEMGIARRADICCDLIGRSPWDLFLTIFGETHSAGHSFWHLSDPNHPLHDSVAREGDDPLLSVFQAIDQAIAKIIKAAPQDAQIVIFAAHGMDANVMDLPSMAFLPEWLYRWNFPGEIGLAAGAQRIPQGPMTGARAQRGWLGLMWSLKHESNPLRRWLRRSLPRKVFDQVDKLWARSDAPDLISPFQLQSQGNSLFFQPALWYSDFWPAMKAFALPSFSEGYLRINLAGREAQGIVKPEDYGRVCDEIIRDLEQLTDARTGKPMVEKVIRTRQSVTDNNPKHPDADIVIIWQDEVVTDVVESPVTGRIGPIPYLRTGSHRSDGFFLAQGPGIECRHDLPEGHALDLAPTLLALMGVEKPEHFPGQSLVSLKAMVH